MDVYNFLIIIPFIVGITLFLLGNEKLLSLILSLFLGGIIYFQFNPFRALYGIVERFIYSALVKTQYLFLLITVVSGPLLFYLLENTGAIELIKRSGNKLSSSKKKWLIPGTLVTLLFIDPNFSSLLSRLFSRPLMKKNKEEKKLAYAINTIPMAITTLVPLTTFTPIILISLNIAYSSIGMTVDIFKILIKSIPYQFYNWLSLFFLFSYFFLETDPFEKIKSRLVFKRFQSDNNLSIKIFKQKVLQTRDKMGAMLGLISGILPVISVIVIALLLAPGSSDSHLPLYIFIRTPSIIASSLFIGIITTVIFIQISHIIISKQKEKKQPASITEINWKSIQINNRFIFTFLYILFALSITRMAELIKVGNLYSSIKFNTIDPIFVPVLAFIFSSTLSFLSGSGALAISIMIPSFLTVLNAIPPQSIIIGKTGAATIGAVISGGVFGQINSPLSTTFLISTAGSETRIEAHFGDQIVNSLFVFLVSCLIYILTFLLWINGITGILIGITIIGLIFVLSSKDKININIKIKNLV